MEKGWDHFIDEMVNKYPGSKDMRTGVTKGGSRMKGFTASDLNLRHQALSHFWGSMLSYFDEKNAADISDILFNDVNKIEEFVSSFFKQLNPNKYKFFVETKEELASGRNPLLGSYPYGRTGKDRARFEAAGSSGTAGSFVGN